MIDMNHKQLYLLLFLFFFTACGEIEIGNNKPQNSEIPSSSIEVPSINSDKKISCQEVERENKYFNHNYQNILDIEPIDKIKILLKKEIPLKKSVDFDQKELYRLFTTEYYWASSISKTFDYRSYTTPQGLIDRLKYIKDKWSFSITVEDYNNATSQKSVGVGVVCQNFQSGCIISYVRINSPADKIDLRRGDIITKIDGKEATEKNFYEKAKKEKEISLEIVRRDTNQHCIGTLTPRQYSYKVVEDKILYTQKNEKIAYLRLDSFLGEKNIEKQLDESFDRFKKRHIEKLVIDLRYNGGGSINLASKLLNKLSTTHIGDEQFTLSWNNTYKVNNQTYRFKSSENSLNLKQIIFLTTGNSASASELIISAMKPYLPEENLVIVGSKTHGKPVGMGGQSDGKFYFFLINFVVKNALGFYDYFEGLPVTAGCDAIDDTFHEMGDPKEKMLETALHYIDEGSCQ